MAKPKWEPVTETFYVEVLRDILDALESHRAAKRLSEPETPPKLIWACDIKPLPEWQWKMNRAAKDGVEQSLLASIRDAGWRAFAAGGNDAMLRLAEQACHGKRDYLAVTLYHNWDGIGVEGKGHWYV